MYSVLNQGWLGTSFILEHASLFFATGTTRAGRSLSNLDLQVSAGVVAFSDDVEQLIPPRKPGLAFTLGAMGSREHNFYNDTYRRDGLRRHRHTGAGSLAQQPARSRHRPRP